MSEAPEEVILKRGDRQWSIRKFGDHQSYLGYTISFGAKWEGEVEDEILELVGNSLSEKAHKLRSIAEPKVLLLLDAYRYAPGYTWMEAISGPLANPFHTIARISNEGLCQILHSLDKDWLGSRSG